jgi:hypothetical protein
MANPISLFDVIAWVETKGNGKLQRFEPATYAAIVASRDSEQQDIIARIQAANLCSWNTALVIYSTSYGATQIMGFNLYGSFKPYTKDVVTFLTSESDQIDQFDVFETEKQIDMTIDVLASSPAARVRYAITYNGSVSYAALISQALQHFGFTVA